MICKKLNRENRQRKLEISHGWFSKKWRLYFAFANVVGILFSLPVNCPAQEKHAFTFSCLNDNFLFEDYLEDYFAKGKDDHVTAGLWLQYRRGTERINWNYSVNFNVLTNRDLLYRTDILSFLVVKNRAFLPAALQTGIGLVLRGNFGGQQLQNKFHDWFGYSRLTLPYLPEPQAGLLFHLDGSYDFLQSAPWHATAYFAGNLVTSAAPGKMETGLQLKWDVTESVAFRLTSGYLRFFRTDK